MPECAPGNHHFDRRGICTKRGCNSARSVLHAVDALIAPDGAVDALDKLERQLEDQGGEEE